MGGFGEIIYFTLFIAGALFGMWVRGRVENSCDAEEHNIKNQILHKSHLNPQ